MVILYIAWRFCVSIRHKTIDAKEEIHSYRGGRMLTKKIDYFYEYGIIILVVSPTAKWTAKSVSNSNGVTTQMAMWKRIAIFYEEIYADGF